MHSISYKRFTSCSKYYLLPPRILRKFGQELSHTKMQPFTRPKVLLYHTTSPITHSGILGVDIIPPSGVCLTASLASTGAISYGFRRARAFHKHGSACNIKLWCETILPLDCHPFPFLTTLGIVFVTSRVRRKLDPVLSLSLMKLT